MAGLSSQSRHEAALDQAAAVHAARTMAAPHEATREVVLQALAVTREHRKTPTAPETSTATPPSSPISRSPPTVRNPANRAWTHKSQHDLFIRHLRSWASNHDSSPYFHGSISLAPQGTFQREIVELGKSVNCVLTSASSGIQSNIVIRLFRTHRDNDDAPCRRVEGRQVYTVHLGAASWDKTNNARNRRGKTQAQKLQPTTSYHLVIRSGSGWVPARQYFDKYYFAHPPKPNPPKNPRKPTLADLTNNLPLSRWAHFASPFIVPAVTVASSDVNTVLGTYTNGQAEDVHDSTQIRTQNSPLHRSRQNGFGPTTKDAVTVSPLFRPFPRLPQELQDEILFQAVGYTRRISLVHSRQAKSGAKNIEAPISISKLFRISKRINSYMVSHIFSSANFHFGTTGFTNFLWQLGPVNRASLNHVTFHFGKQSLLHCIRWTAPDPVYELFEPGVATQPSSLSYFWRCQLQDLMKELNLSTLTIDVSGVPVADIPMLVKIFSTAVGSVERIQVRESHGRCAGLVENCVGDVQDLCARFPDLPRLTWRELCQRYHSDYRRYRWHMRDLWTMHGDENLKAFDEWIDKDKAFFDS